MADLVAQRLIDDQAALQQAYNLEHPPAAEQPTPAHQTDTANSLQRRETDLQSRESAMMAKMQEMMITMMRNNNNNKNTNNNNNNNRNNRGGGNSTGRGGGRSGGRSNNRSQTRLYCWSHGACAHASPDCNRPATGHQTTATFENMMAGSKNGCYWLT
jgi:hypothetical protein